MQSYKTTNCYYLTLSEYQNFNCSLAGWFWNGVSYDIAVKKSDRARVTWRLSWDWSIHLQNRLLTQLWPGGLLLTTRISPQGSLSVLTTWQLCPQGK